MEVCYGTSETEASWSPEPEDLLFWVPNNFVHLASPLGQHSAAPKGSPAPQFPQWEKREDKVGGCAASPAFQGSSQEPWAHLCLASCRTLGQLAGLNHL